MSYFTGKARPVATPGTTVALLRAFGPATEFVDGMLARVAFGSSYEWKSTESAADNGTTIIKPNDVSGNGRWVIAAGAGAQGAQGFQGLQGAQGLQGSTGAQGLQGAAGAAGAQGAQGFQGLQGAQGAQGSQGNQGFQGANDQPVGSTTLTFASGTTADVTAYTVPASPTGTKRFVCTFMVIRLDVAIVGAGTVVVRGGTTTGGNDLLVDSTAWSSGTAVGTAVGLILADLGTAFPVNAGYIFATDAGTTFKARATSGTISAGSAKVYVFGFFMP